MTIKEYRTFMRAYALKSIDEQEKLFVLAWIIRQAKARRKSGRPFYTKFKQFFNRSKIEKQVFNEKDTTSLAYRIQKAMEIEKEQERK